MDLDGYWVPLWLRWPSTHIIFVFLQQGRFSWNICGPRRWGNFIGQLGVWQSSNDDWKHICSKMYISINYVDINIYPLTMECNAPLSMFMERAQYQMTILLLLLLLLSRELGGVWFNWNKVKSQKTFDSSAYNTNHGIKTLVLNHV